MRLKKKKKKVDRSKMVFKGYNKTYDFRNLKQWVFLVMKLEIMLLICKEPMMNKIICQSILKNLKLKQSHKIILI